MRIIRKIFSCLVLVTVCGAVSLGSTLFVLTSAWAIDGISGMAKTLAGIDTVPAKRKTDFDDLKSRTDAQSKRVGKATKGIKSRSAKMVVRNTADVAVSDLVAVSGSARSAATMAALTLVATEGRGT